MIACHHVHATICSYKKAGPHTENRHRPSTPPSNELPQTGATMSSESCDTNLVPQAPGTSNTISTDAEVQKSQVEALYKQAWVDKGALDDKLLFCKGCGYVLSDNVADWWGVWWAHKPKCPPIRAWLKQRAKDSRKKEDEEMAEKMEELAM